MLNMSFSKLSHMGQRKCNPYAFYLFTFTLKVIKMLLYKNVLNSKRIYRAPNIPRKHSMELFYLLQFRSVQSLSRVRLFATLWTAARQAFLSITSSWSLPKLISIESVMLSNYFILCHPLLLPPSIFPSIRVFSVLHIRCSFFYF